MSLSALSSIQEAGQSFIESVKDSRSAATYHQYRHLMSHSIIPYIGNISIKELDVPNYQKLCIEPLRKKRISAKSLVLVTNCLKTMLEYLQKNGIIQDNPLSGYSPASQKKKPAYIVDIRTLKYIDDLIEKSGPRSKAAFEILERTGLRLEELLALRWEDFDSANEVFHVRYIRNDYGMRKIQNPYAKRDVPVSVDLLCYLEVFQVLCRKRYHSDQKSFIVLSSRGNPITPSLVPRRLKQILSQSSIYSIAGKFTVRSFRSEFRAIMENQKVPERDINKFLGCQTRSRRKYMPKLGSKIEKTIAG